LSKTAFCFEPSGQQLQVVMPVILLKALPQSLDGLGRAFNALNENLFGVEQMARDALLTVALSALQQQVEQMQTAQLVGSF
jgi:hypothetical protein